MFPRRSPVRRSLSQLVAVVVATELALALGTGLGACEGTSPPAVDIDAAIAPAIADASVDAPDVVYLEAAAPTTCRPVAGPCDLVLQDCAPVRGLR